jgi:hypothetical protein
MQKFQYLGPFRIAPAHSVQVKADNVFLEFFTCGRVERAAVIGFSVARAFGRFSEDVETTGLPDSGPCAGNYPMDPILSGRPGNDCKYALGPLPLSFGVRSATAKDSDP